MELVYEWDIDNPEFLKLFKSLTLQTKIYYEMKEFNSYRELILNELGQEPN